MTDKEKLDAIRNALDEFKPMTDKVRAIRTILKASTESNKCGCTDSGCPAHHGCPDCRREATARVYRIDMTDETGTPMCEDCAADALESGVFTDTRVASTDSEVLDDLYGGNF